MLMGFGNLAIVLVIGLSVLALVWYTFNRDGFARKDHTWSISGAAMYGTAGAFAVGSAVLIGLAML